MRERAASMVALVALLAATAATVAEETGLERQHS
jgi:hypothetical protein